MLPETTNFKVLNKTSCNDSSILLFFRKVILKWVGVPGGKIGLNVEKRSFFQGLTLFHMGGADSALLQIVFFITSVRDAAEPRNSVSFPKI